MRALSLLCCATIALTASLASQPSRDSLLIRDGGVGHLTVGVSIDSMYKLVNRTHTRLVDRRREGLFDPAIEIRRTLNDQRPSLIVEVRSSPCGHLVGRITVLDARYHTATGLHVGSTLADVRRALHVSISGEEGLHAISTSPALLFDIASEATNALVTAISVQTPIASCAALK